MNKINNKELAERAANLTDKIEDAMVDESPIVCTHALAFMVAKLLIINTDARIARVELGARLFYEQLLKNIKAMEQAIEDYEKAN